MGVPNSTDSNDRPLNSNSIEDRSETQPFYGLSPIFKVVEDTSLSGNVTISGTAQSGYVITADTSAIMDTDGLTNVDYDFQWIRVDSDGSSNPTNIGTDFNTYALVNADVGSKIKVKVDFTDDANNDHTLTSAAYPSSGTVIAGNTNIPQLSITDAQANEGDAVTFTVTADSTSTQPMTAIYVASVKPGDTAEIQDFTNPTGTVLITAGNTSATFEIPTRDDPQTYEGDETFTVTLSSPANATIANATAKGTILVLQSRL